MMTALILVNMLLNVALICVILSDRKQHKETPQSEEDK